mmetsp:Transcript_11972/g.23326  ORF Transcript_11972/g.23326 Transcript_11972/m.23326 type:complete len:200 (+) Transcript_11972:3472-4071(+)
MSIMRRFFINIPRQRIHDIYHVLFYFSQPLLSCMRRLFGPFAQSSFGVIIFMSTVAHGPFRQIAASFATQCWTRNGTFTGHEKRKDYLQPTCLYEGFTRLFVSIIDSFDVTISNICCSLFRHTPCGTRHCKVEYFESSSPRMDFLAQTSQHQFDSLILNEVLDVIFAQQSRGQCIKCIFQKFAFNFRLWVSFPIDCNRL